MKDKLIYGIQQIGVGVNDASEALEWYATKLGSDVVIFDDEKVATDMAPYMGGKSRNKRAIMSMNLQGGSGYELWQYTERTPQGPNEQILLGDLGINISKIKSRDIERSFDRLKKEGVNVLSEVLTDPIGRKHFFIKDPYGNPYQVHEEENAWFKKRRYDLGGLSGCILGVTDIDHSLQLYKDILCYDQILYDVTDTFSDFRDLDGGSNEYRRICLAHQDCRRGGFSRLFGNSTIELVEVKNRKPKKIFADRFWGDLGFIHLCFDIKNMSSLVEECKSMGFPFSVLSNPEFDMGDANAQFGYLEDPDGTLIEFVEIHRVPLVPKMNWNINMKGRDPHKPLPYWLINAMSLNRVKF